MKYGTYYPQDTGSLEGSHLSQLFIRVATANLSKTHPFLHVVCSVETAPYTFDYTHNSNNRVI